MKKIRPSSIGVMSYQQHTRLELCLNERIHLSQLLLGGMNGLSFGEYEFHGLSPAMS
jgi:hypothetical protein